MWSFERYRSGWWALLIVFALHTVAITGACWWATSESLEISEEDKAWPQRAAREPLERASKSHH